jgi:hypothetical protein
VFGRERDRGANLAPARSTRTGIRHDARTQPALDGGLSPAKPLDRGGQLFVRAVRATAVHDTGRALEAGLVDATGLALIAGGELKDSSKLDGSGAV